LTKRSVAAMAAFIACLPLGKVGATNMADPTQPPARVLLEEERARRIAAGGEAAKNLPPLPNTDGVRVIVNGADRKLAVIDGEIVKTKNPGTLPIHPNVKKTAVTEQKPARSNPDSTSEKRPVKVIQR
jgi:hypothetical protein